MTLAKTEKKVDPIGFRPTDEVTELLKWAQKETGSNRSDLISACITKVMRQVVEEEIQRGLKEAQARADRMKAK